MPVELAGAFVDASEAHGVLGAVLKNFEAFRSDPAFAGAYQLARQRHRANAAFALMLDREAGRLISDLKGVSATIVKGPVFARCLYPTASLRPFTDIDILAAEESLTRVGEILADHGFQLAERHPRETKWVHRDNADVMVEVQTDLIHPDSLHGVVSLPYRLIGGAPERPAALLLIAIVHGGAHQFDRLKYCVDICQAVRMLNSEDEEQAFFEMLDAPHAQYLAYAGLMLTARLFGEPRCRVLASRLRHVRFRIGAERLFDRTTVLSSTDRRRRFHHWRRQYFRILLRWNAGRLF